MRVIELLNEIADKKLKDKTIIEFNGDKYLYRVGYDGIWDVDGAEIDLMDKIWVKKLNSEIEIIEEDKKLELPEKLNYNEKEFEDDVVELEYGNGTLELGSVIIDFAKRIDGILDYLKQKEESERINE